MTITAEGIVQIYEFAGYQDPSLPIGAWAGVRGVTGDASGGSRILDLVFAAATQPRASTMFSLEQLSVFDEEETEKGCLIQTINLGIIGDIAFDQIFNVLMRTGPTTGQSSAGSGADGANLPLFLGRQQGRSVGTFLRASVINSLNNDFIFNAQGYMWGARSINAPGGPRRPIGGLFRA